MQKRYLGDAVYMDDDSYYLVLTTSDGIRDTNRICVEPYLFDELVRYINQFKAERTAFAGLKPNES